MVRQWGRERPDLPLAGVGVQARVKLLAKHFQREADRALEPFELEPWAWEILAALRRQAEPFEATPGRLCRYTGVTSGSITNRIDRLESRGYVLRHPDPADRRGVLVRLTDTGLDLVQRAASARFRIAQERMSPLDAGERELLEGFLRRLLAAYPESQEVPDADV